MSELLWKKNRFLLSQLFILVLLFLFVFVFILFDWSHKKYIVFFDSDGGNQISSQLIYEGNKVTVPMSPKRQGYLFLGWYENNVPFDFKIRVYSNIQLKAKWEEI